jgi:hypothetical protein
MIEEYAAFSRSFTKIRAADIREQIDSTYATRKYWPEPIVQINPHYKRDRSVADLVRDGVLHRSCDVIFRDWILKDAPGSVDLPRTAKEKLRRHYGHRIREVGVLLCADY